MKVTDFVFPHNTAQFEAYRAGFFWYEIMGLDGKKWLFCIPREDLGPGSELKATEKAVTLMRWIRQAINNNTMVRQSKAPTPEYTPGPSEYPQTPDRNAKPNTITHPDGSMSLLPPKAVN